MHVQGLPNQQLFNQLVSGHGGVRNLQDTSIES